MGELKEKTIKGVIWSAVERFSVQGIDFVVGIIIARLLLPSDYGLIGMLAIFMSISQVFIDGGFSSALIQYKDRSEADYSTVFFINFAISILVYGILYILAPYIADFYHQPVLTSITRVYTLILVINSLVAVNRTRLTIQLNFKMLSRVSFMVSCVAGGLGIFLAYSGYGVWSLVYMAISSSILNVLLLLYFTRWVPLPFFSIESFHRLFKYGSKLLVASLIGNVYSNLYNLVIGKKFSTINLGYYTRADGLAGFAGLNISNILQRVAFPVLSELQDNDEVLLAAYRKYIKLSAFIIFPLIFGLFGVAKPLLLCILTEKWSGSILLLQILCFAYLWDAVIRINLNLLYVKGRSDLVLRLEIIKKMVAVTILFASIPFGLVGICLGRVLYSFIAFYMNTYYTNKLLGYGFFTQIKELIPSLFISFLVALEGLILSHVIERSFVAILLAFIVCPLTYIACSKILKMEQYQEIKSILRMRIN